MHSFGNPTRAIAAVLAVLVLASCGTRGERGLSGDSFGDSLDHSPSEEGYYYQLITLPVPDGVELEVGGLDVLPDGRPAVATRRGEVWLVDGAYDSDPQPDYRLFAQGLHEPLGLLWKDGSFYSAQRGELTRMQDANGDDRADVYETVYAWPLTGNYHEYSFGPLALKNGNLFVSLNLGWFGRGGSEAKWRGWALEITPEGEATPLAAGFRSPAGIGITSSGDVFYGENQGDWIGSGWISHIEKGDFLGHPASLRWSDEPESPLRLAESDVPDTGDPMFRARETVPELKLPAVWFPHTVMGISTSAIIEDATGGDFGPFAGQLLVGDQGHSKLMRVFLERINGAYQGAVFPFYEGFSSGILRTAWGADNSLFVGQTSRGWAATGKEPFALERLVWTGKTPFEMKAIRSAVDGFEVEFTMPVDPASLLGDSTFVVTSFTYKYHSTYGSPAINVQPLKVTVNGLSDDDTTVKLAVEGLRAGYIHEFRLGDVRSVEGVPLLHDQAFYTLNSIRDGASVVGSGPGSSASSPEQAAAGDGNAGERAARRPVEMPPSWGGEVDHRVEIRTEPGLRFDVSAFDVRPGSRVALTFVNDDDMSHNLVVTAVGAADEVVAAAIDLGIRGQGLGYVPEGGGAAESVLYHTALLEPEASETLYFEAPSVAGQYPFVCTFPGHGVTMRGVMTVR